MAIWQIDIKLISPEYCYLQDHEYWFLPNYHISSKSLEKISKILSYQKSWTDEIIQMGFLDQTCIQIYSEDNAVQEITLRLDLRSINLLQIKAILLFAQENQLQLLFQNHLFLPTLENIKVIINDSKAKSFLTNPEVFLESLKKSEIDSEV